MTAKNGAPPIDHTLIDRAFRELIDAFRVDDGGDPSALYDALAKRIRAHLHAEDAAFARFAFVDAEEATALLAEHRAIEATMDTLAAKAARGALRLRDVYDFKIRFALHEAREETGYYRRTPEERARPTA